MTPKNNHFQGEDRHFLDLQRQSSLNLKTFERPPKGLLGYIFPFEPSQRGYSLEGYLAEYSEGQISFEQCQALVEDINSIKEINLDVSVPLKCLPFWFAVAGLIIGIVSFALYRMHRFFAFWVSLGSGVGLAFLSGLIVAIKSRRYKKRRSLKIKEIILQHQAKTFDAKDTQVSLSPDGLFLSMKFNWKCECPLETRESQRVALNILAIGSSSFNGAMVHDLAICQKQDLLKHSDSCRYHQEKWWGSAFPKSTTTKKQVLSKRGIFKKGSQLKSNQKPNLNYVEEDPSDKSPCQGKTTPRSRGPQVSASF